MSKKKSVKFVYFDLGGVVIDNRAGVQSVARKFKVDPESIKDILKQNWQAACRGLMTNKEYLGLFKPLNIFHHNENFVDFWSDHQEIYQETLEFINELGQTYDLGILSNAELGMVEMHMRKKKLPRDIWTVVIESAQHMTIKPEKKIYEIAQKAAKVKPEEIFFTDDVTEHIKVAKSLGWQGMVFDTDDISGSIKRIKNLLL